MAGGGDRLLLTGGVLVQLRIMILTIVGLVCTVASAQAQMPEDSLRTYVTDINGLTGVYLGKGLVLTAAHVVGGNGTHLQVGIAGTEVAAKVIKAGSFNDVDLSLLSVEEAALPIRVRMRRLELCERPPQVGQPVIVAGHDTSVPSRIASPLLLAPNFRAKFSTIIPDVATTGNSGSGVFDAGRKCLLGIMSRKFSTTDAEGGIKDIAKYFVPASEIREFMPTLFRF
jgi:S1-C subfamily serine protease